MRARPLSRPGGWDWAEGGDLFTVAVGDKGKQKQESRRGFLRRVMWMSAGLLILETTLAGLAMFWPRRVEGFGAVIRAGSLSDFPVGTVTRVRDGRFYISRLPQGLIALYWRCPHLGCTVPWNEQEGLFLCPCHGSVYERTGQNIAGPAPRPLDYMNVWVEGEDVYVDTGNIRERGVHRPDHVTPV